MQLLVQQHQAQLDAVSSRWASLEAKIITLVNSCLLAPAGQVCLRSFWCSCCVALHMRHCGVIPLMRLVLLRQCSGCDC
jgi:hypothetical protein